MRFCGRPVWPLGLLCVLLVALPVAGWSQATVLAFFEQAKRGGGDSNIMMQRVAPDGTVGWNKQPPPRALANSSDRESLPVACADGNGGAIVAYQYEFTSGEHKGDVDVVAQRVDATGKLLWNKGETPMGVGGSSNREGRPAILSDGQGGAFIVYEWTDKNGDIDLLAQHLNAQGKLLWGDGKTPATVANSPKPERNPVLVSDGAGGFICVYEWQGDKGDTDIMAQHVTAAGKETWVVNDQALDVAASDNAESHATAVSDGAGGVLLAYEVEFLAGDDKGDHDIMGQRISADGKLLWNDGKPLPIIYSKGRERRPVALTDRSGGMLVACESELVEADNAGDIDIVAQRVSADGKLLWKQGEKSVAVASTKQIERAVRGVRASADRFIFVFEMEFRDGESKGDVDLAAQCVDADGNLVWNNGEKSVLLAASKWLERSGVVLADGEGGIVVVYPDAGTEEKFKGDLDVEATRLSADGKLLWNEGKEAAHLADSENLERNPTAVVVAGGGQED